MIEDDIEYDDIDGGGWQRRWHQWQQVPVGSRQETAAATVRPISSWSLCDVMCIEMFFAMFNVMFVQPILKWYLLHNTVIAFIPYICHFFYTGKIFGE